MKFHTSLVQTRFDCPLGPMIAAATDHGLAGLWFDDQRHLPPEVATWPRVDLATPVAAPHSNARQVLVQTQAQLHAYFAGTRSTFDLPLDLAGGTAFQQAVWQALLALPAGTTTSYGRLSASMGNPHAVRAVGAAVGRNPVSIIVPCHRVLGSDGALTGYAGGLHRKTALLTLEGVAVPPPPAPLKRVQPVQSATTESPF